VATAERVAALVNHHLACASSLLIRLAQSKCQLGQYNETLTIWNTNVEGVQVDRVAGGASTENRGSWPAHTVRAPNLRRRHRTDHLCLKQAAVETFFPLGDVLELLLQVGGLGLPSCNLSGCTLHLVAGYAELVA